MSSFFKINVLQVFYKLFFSFFELLNFQGIFDYCSPMGIKRFGSKKKRREFYKPGNKMAISMTSLFKAIYKIGPWVFVHGGIRSLLSKKMLTRIGINLIIKEARERTTNQERT